MIRRSLVAAAVALPLLLAACSYGSQGAGSQAPGGAGTLTVAHTSAGDALAGAGGKTLYINTQEQGGQIACTGGCADAWPPLTGTATAGTGVSGTLGTITRPDGSVQVTYDGMPLYYYASDTAAGDAKGQGVGGIWYIASPAGNGSSSAPSSTPYRAPGY
jgi:predicted lipoprotein with Yx(FWY)xxD motif